MGSSSSLGVYVYKVTGWASSGKVCRGRQAGVVTLTAEGFAPVGVRRRPAPCVWFTRAFYTVLFYGLFGLLPLQASVRCFARKFCSRSFLFPFVIFNFRCIAYVYLFFAFLNWGWLSNSAEDHCQVLVVEWFFLFLPFPPLSLFILASALSYLYTSKIFFAFYVAPFVENAGHPQCLIIATGGPGATVWVVVRHPALREKKIGWHFQTGILLT